MLLLVVRMPERTETHGDKQKQWRLIMLAKNRKNNFRLKSDASFMYTCTCMSIYKQGAHVWQSTRTCMSVRTLFYIQVGEASPIHSVT